MVPNLYPALGADGADGHRGGDPLASGRGDPDLFAARPASGAHEVIVNTPESVSSLHDLGPMGCEPAMEVWRDRMRAHAGRVATCI